MAMAMAIPSCLRFNASIELQQHAGSQIEYFHTIMLEGVLFFFPYPYLAY